MLNEILTKHGLQNQLSTLKKVGRSTFLRVFHKPLALLSDFYFALGKLYFRRQATSVRDDPADLDSTTTNESIEQSFILMLTASSLGQKQARAYLAILMENGMIPSSEVIQEMTSKKFEFLRYIAAKNEIQSYNKPDSYTLVEYK